MNTKFIVFLVAVIAVFAAGLPLSQASEKTPQQLLFDAPYLTQLTIPSALQYRYRHKTADEKTFGPVFEDTIAVKISPNERENGLNTVNLEIFTGARGRRLGPHLNMKGNPIIMIFLERDLWEMKRRIGGVPIFYRNKIRRALRQTTDIEQTETRYNGKTLPAWKVTIKPFLAEKENRRLQLFLDKTYEFTVAEQVPGGFVQIRALVPDAKNAGSFLIEDELRFISEE